MAELKSRKHRTASDVTAPERVSLWVLRILVLLTLLMVFFPPFNPGRISTQISGNLTLLTSATSLSTVTTKLSAYMVEGIRFALRASDMRLSMLGCAMILIGAVLAGAGACVSLGNRKMRRIGGWFPPAGAALILGGLAVNRAAYTSIENFVRGMDLPASHIEEHLNNLSLRWPEFANSAWTAAGCAVLAVSLISLFFAYRTRCAENKAEMEEKYKLFIMFLPVLILSFVFAYLPIYGWRYAFYDAKAGDELTKEIFVGFNNFTMLINDPGFSAKILQVLRNTLVMSGLGIATSWLPIAFAILLAEIRSTKFQRTVQTLTTIPNFLSWVLVYAVALSIFAADGLINNLSRLLSTSGFTSVDYLASADATWIKMLLWGTWKGLGWSAIIYIAGIAGIDQQLYEAAKVDGAGRFRCIWHITVPGLIPTYMVMLLMSVAGILSNGMEQYLVFSNPYNGDFIQVLDLYVYNLGIGSNQLSVSTVIGILKSVIAVILLFGANGISKAVRGESII
ncbi:MAG: ABC transporter permease subunit [Clostridiales bacterium]|nr:ABC transporter permease subunit [Clostridiales bacterium]